MQKYRCESAHSWTIDLAESSSVPAKNTSTNQWTIKSDLKHAVISCGWTSDLLDGLGLHRCSTGTGCCWPPWWLRRAAALGLRGGRGLGGGGRRPGTKDFKQRHGFSPASPWPGFGQLNCQIWRHRLQPWSPWSKLDVEMSKGLSIPWLLWPCISGCIDACVAKNTLELWHRAAIPLECSPQLPVVQHNGTVSFFARIHSV